VPVEAPAQFKLRANLQVDGEGIFLNQVLESGSNLPHLRLCDAPAFGKSIALKRDEILTLASSAGLESVPTNWTGPLVTRICRRVRPLAEKELLELLTASLQQHYVKDLGRLELRASRPWTPVSVPDEAFVIQVSDLPTSGVSPAFIARFELQTAFGEHLGSWQVSLQAKVWREVWVARSTVKRGDSVHGADLTRERRDLLLFHEPFAELSADDSALEFIEALQPGTPLLARLVRPRSIVHRGQSLAAVVRDGALMITLKVEALEDGAAGQSIRVRNPLSRRDLHARVIDEANVQVSL
jgi:flagella basal body P-ring formation protein FlgA